MFEPVYERFLTIRHIEASSSLRENEEGVVVDCTREVVDTYNWHSQGEKSDVDISLHFSEFTSGFKVGDKIRVVVGLVERKEEGREAKKK